jgi:hypothetical protein
MKSRPEFYTTLAALLFATLHILVALSPGASTMPIEYDKLFFNKGTPRVALKMARATLKAKAERECRIAVDRRDGRRCFVFGCRKYAREKHHIVKRSQGGPWITSNILSACTPHHQYLTAGLIRTSGNPDVKDDLQVHLTALGKAAKISIPKRAA